MGTQQVGTVPRTADQAASKPHALRKLLPSAFVIVVYFLIGVIAFWPVYPGISQRLFSSDSDFAQSVWFLDWIPHALSHGLNPFYSNAIFVPTGVNLAQSTESPLLGLLTAPFAAVLSPVVRANIVLLLGMPASATAAFVVLRRWKVWHPAAAIGGLMYGFSPYMVSQGIGHLELIFVPLPPLIALTVVSIMQGSGSPRRLGIWLGLLVAAQYLISPEVLATVVLFTLAGVACVVIGRRVDVAQLGRRAFQPLGVALVVAFLLLAYPVWMLLAGPQHFAGPAIAITNGFHNDLLDFVVPGPSQRVPLGLRSVAAHLNVGSDSTEVGGYIGVPLLILTGILVWFSRRSPRTWLTGVLFLGAVLLTLGPYLAVDGHLSGIPLPFLLLDHLPLLNSILPSRISFEVGAFLAALVAFGLDDFHHDLARRSENVTDRRRWPRRWTSSLIVGATLAVLVITQLPQWPYAGAESRFSTQSAALPARIVHAIPTGDPVAITYPYDTFLEMQPMLWQVDTNFDFRLLGGYAYRPDSSGHSAVAALMRPRGLQQFLANQSGLSTYGELYGPAPPVGPKLVAATRASLSRYDVRLVVVDRSTSRSGQVMELFYAALGPPTVSVGHYSIWADWRGWPKREVFLPHIVTKVIRPAKGATLSRKVVLAASATAWVGVTKVEFRLTDVSRHTVVTFHGALSLYGWFAALNTTTLRNGTYLLQSIAYDAQGVGKFSSSVQITIKNP